MDEWVGFYERRLRDDRDDPLLRRGDLDRVLGADVEGRRRAATGASSSRSTSRPRAGASRRSTSTSSSTRAPAPSTSPSPRATSSAPSPSCGAAASASCRSRTPTTTTCPSACRQVAGQLDDLRRAGDPRRPRRRGLPAADLHQAGRRPADRLLRDHRAPRRARLRRGQLQGAVRGDRARAGQAGEPLMRYATPRRASRPSATSSSAHERQPADRGGPRLRGLLRQRVDPLPPALAVPGQGGRRLRADRARRVGARDARPPAHRHERRSSRAATGSTGRRLLQFNDDIEVSICKPTEDRDGFYRNGEGDEVLFIHHGTGIVETIFGDVPYRQHDYVVIPRGTTYRVRCPTPASRSGSASSRRARSRRRTATATATASCSSTRRSASATSIRRRELRTHARARRVRADGARPRRPTRPTSSTTTRSTSSAGTATSTRTRSTPTTSSRSPAASTSRRRCTRPSRARTS